ncbi:ParB/RepB/Spo0J family partition protein [Candidatus Bathyarchaeota archaeon]|nr:ParB/RepB/Spo0J family partition protein [Candidatus Bathyarchaeota archaeon]
MADTIRDIELKKIHPSKLNPRLEINIERLNELAASIREVGLLEPIIVRPSNGEFEVVVGERRYRAAQQAGLDKIPAIIRNYSDDEVVQLNLIENIQRDDLSAIEKGKVCKYLLENCPEKYPSASVVGAKIGVSGTAVSLWLRSVEVVPEEAQKYVAPADLSGQIPEGKIDYATAIKVGRAVEDTERKVEVIRKLAEKHLPSKAKTEVVKKVAREPEKPVEEIIEEAAEMPCEMRFPAEDKEKLLNGLKKQISMVNMPDPKVKAGTLVHATVWEPHIADLRVTEIERKRLKYFDEEDAKREGGFTLAEFKAKWKAKYGEWDDNQLVYVIHFEKA